MFSPKIGEDEPVLTSIFFKGVGSTTNQFCFFCLGVPLDRTPQFFGGGGIKEYDMYVYIVEIVGAICPICPYNTQWIERFWGKNLPLSWTDDPTLTCACFF